MPVKAGFLRSTWRLPRQPRRRFCCSGGSPSPRLLAGERRRAPAVASPPVGATAEVRSERLFLTEPPGGRDCWRPGWCGWCGEKIVLVDPAKEYRRRSRTRHYGDEYEVGDRRCDWEFGRSYCWNARTALYIIAADAGRPIACAECGLVCAEKTREEVAWIDERGIEQVVAAGDWLQLERWDADHRVPLIDDGAHDVDNLQVLCVPCHRRKTSREARAR